MARTRTDYPAPEIEMEDGEIREDRILPPPPGLVMRGPSPIPSPPPQLMEDDRVVLPPPPPGPPPGLAMRIPNPIPSPIPSPPPTPGYGEAFDDETFGEDREMNYYPGDVVDPLVDHNDNDEPIRDAGREREMDIEPQPEVLTQMEIENPQDVVERIPERRDERERRNQDKGKRKVQDEDPTNSREPKRTRANSDSRPLGGHVEGQRLGNGEGQVGDRQGDRPDRPEEDKLKDLKSHLKARISNYSDEFLDNNFMEQVTGELSIYMNCGCGKDAILPTKPQLQSRSLESTGRIIFTNYYCIHFKKSADRDQPPEFILYYVAWPRELRRPALRGKRLQLWRKIFENLWANNVCIRMYDGGACMVSNRLIPTWDPNIANEFQIIDERSPQMDLGRLVVGKPQRIDFDELERFCRKQEGAEFPLKLVKAANLIMKHYLRMQNYVALDRFHFDTASGSSMEKRPEHLRDEILTKKSGYFQSVRLLAGGMTLNVDVIATAFYKPERKLADIWAKLVDRNYLPDDKTKFFRGWGPDRPLSIEQVGVINEYWRNLKIELDNRRQLREDRQGRNQQKRKYTIHSVMEVPAYQQLVTLIPGNQDGDVQPQEQSLIQFMKDKYQWTEGSRRGGYDDLLSTMPAIQLISASKNVDRPVNLYVPWGCCWTSDASRVNGPMPKLLPLLQNTAKNKYNDIANWITDRYVDLGSSSLEGERDFNMHLEQSMMSVTALSLNRPKLSAGQEQEFLYTERGNNSSFSFQKDQRFAKAGTISRYGIISFLSPDLENEEQTLTRELIKTARSRGMHWNVKEQPYRLDLGCTHDYNRNSRELLRTIETFANDCRRDNKEQQRLDLILCFMPYKMSPEYRVVKYCLDQISGVPSQVIVLKKSWTPRNQNSNNKYPNNQARGPTKMLVDNLLLKINVKCGGANFQIDSAIIQDMRLLNDTMLMGLDVTHPPSGAKDRRPSIVALVATTDSSYVNYASRLRTQLPGQELTDSETTKEMVRELLEVYKATAGRYPRKIIFFRDGLSESQYLSTLRFEGTAILKAASELFDHRNAPYKPRLVMILSVKGHHSRFFECDPMNQSKKATRGGMEANNVKAGTVVNEKVTHPREYDFYLCSHDSPLGTSRAIKYHVVLDQINVDQDVLYQTIYNLCHTFQRCPKSVSLVTPVSYAHLAAARARLYLDQYLAEAKEDRNIVLNFQSLRLNAHGNLRNRLWFL